MGSPYALASGPTTTGRAPGRISKIAGRGPTSSPSAYTRTRRLASTSTLVPVRICTLGCVVCEPGEHARERPEERGLRERVDDAESRSPSFITASGSTRIPPPVHRPLPTSTSIASVSIRSSSTLIDERRRREPRERLQHCGDVRAGRAELDRHAVRGLVHLGVESGAGDVDEAPADGTGGDLDHVEVRGLRVGEQRDRGVELPGADRPSRSRRRCRREGRRAPRRSRGGRSRRARRSRRRRGRPRSSCHPRRRRAAIRSTSGPDSETRISWATPSRRSPVVTLPISLPALPWPAAGFATTTTSGASAMRSYAPGSRRARLGVEPGGAQRFVLVRLEPRHRGVRERRGASARGR